MPATVPKETSGVSHSITGSGLDSQLRRDADAGDRATFAHRAPRARSLLLAQLLTCVLSFTHLAGAENQEAPPTDAEVAQAVEQLKADPNLAREQTIQRLQWAREGAPQRVPEWLREFFHWLTESIRVLMWVGIAALVAILVVLIARLLRQIERRGRTEALPEAPTHVRDLDIRPESLPDDIGAAALQLWNRGERRAALSLLYRGLLSRLVHVHAVPIQESSTEGDCLDLARRHLPSQWVGYAQQLIDVWQRSVYGARDPDGDEVRELCDRFERELGVSPPRVASP